jgi:predicted nucleotidyltransferase
MGKQHGWVDAPARVRGQVERLVDAFRSLLGPDLTGVYLHGSLAMGCFNPERSDVDLLVVTRRGLTVEEKRRMAETLLAVSNEPRPIEISVLREADLRPWRHPAPFDFHYGEGTWRELFREELAGDGWRLWNDETAHDADLAAHITVTRARGVRLAGEPIDTVFPAVPGSDYYDSILGDLRWVRGHSGGNSVYGVLNACRVLAYAEAGRVLSKDEGGAWAIEALPAEHRDVIGAALATYRGESDAEGFEPAAFARFIAEVERRLPATLDNGAPAGRTPS